MRSKTVMFILALLAIVAAVLLLRPDALERVEDLYWKLLARYERGRVTVAPQDDMGASYQARVQEDRQP